MRKSVFFALLNLLLTGFISGQVKPDNFDKKIEEALQTYAASYNILANKESETIKKKAAVLKVKNLFSSTGTYIFDDITYIKTGEESLTKMGDVFKNIESYYPLGHKIMFNTNLLGIGPIEKNYERNSLTTEVKAKKKIDYREEVEIQDSIKTDTVNGDTTFFTHTDTVVKSEIISVSIIFKYDIEDGQLVNLQIDAISKLGMKHKFKPLSGDDEWWVNLDKEWKKFFIEELKMPEFPDKYDFGKLDYIGKLDLSGTGFKDYTPITKLSGVKILDLSKSSFSDAALLFEMKYLRNLDLSESKITSIEKLGNLENLEVLKLNKLELKSIEPLKTLPNLLELEVVENELEDIEAVKNMEKLERIDFSLNLEIETIQPLAGLTNLTKVSFAKMKVKDLAPLSNCPNLVELNCFNNEITSLKPISRCYKLTTLNIGYNKIYTLDELSGMKYIMELYLRGAPIDDISVCRNFEHLQKIDLSETNVENLSPLYNAEDIRVLTLIDSKVSVSEKDRFKKRFPKCRLTYY